MQSPSAGGPSSPGAEGSLRSRAIRGSAWWAAAYPFSKGIQVASNVILAGLLSPAAFGVMALGTIVVGAVKMFSEIGVRYALIQSERDDDAFLNTAWTMQIGRGILVSLVAVALAGPMAAFYGEDQLRSLIPAIGLVAIVQGLQSTKYVTLNRQLREKPRALLDLATSVVTRGVMIGAALIWPSAWALAIGTLFGTAFLTTATHLLPGMRNRLAWDPGAVRILVRFGVWVFVGTVIAFLGSQLDKVVLGKLVSEHLESLGLVGIYVIAQRVARLPLEATQVLGGQLAFPVLAEIARSDRPRFQQRLVKIRGVLLAPGLAACVAVVMLSPFFFDFLYDERYEAAIWMAPLFVFSVWLGLLNSMVNKALLSLGRTRALAMTGVVRLVSSTAGALVGFYIAEIPGFIIGMACGTLLQHVTELLYLARDRVYVFSQDLLYSALLALVGGGGALCVAQFRTAETPLFRWGVGVVIPAVVLAGVTAWAGLCVWRAIRKPTS